MEFIPVQTRVLIPPKDDLFSVLDESLPALREEDIVLVSSKVVALHEGRCMKVDETDKAALIKEEADLFLELPDRKFPLTVKHHALSSGAGVDESNGNGYYVLLPEAPFDSAKEMWTYLRKKYEVEKLGVIITDSQSTPLRFGATGVSIGFWGVEPTVHHEGKKDLFGREFRVEYTNVIDSLAASSVLVSGECAESCPVVIARGVPQVAFSKEDMRHELLAPREEDRFKVFFETFERRKEE